VPDRRRYASPPNCRGEPWRLKPGPGAGDFIGAALIIAVARGVTTIMNNAVSISPPGPRRLTGFRVEHAKPAAAQSPEPADT